MGGVEIAAADITRFQAWITAGSTDDSPRNREVPFYAALGSKFVQYPRRRRSGFAHFLKAPTGAHRLPAAEHQRSLVRSRTGKPERGVEFSAVSWVPEPTDIIARIAEPHSCHSSRVIALTTSAQADPLPRPPNQHPNLRLRLRLWRHFESAAGRQREPKLTRLDRRDGWSRIRKFTEIFLFFRRYERRYHT